MENNAFLSVTIEMDNKETYQTEWDSGNISIGYVDPIELKKTDFTKIKSGESFMKICNEYVERVCSNWKSEMPEYVIPSFTGDYEKIELIANFNKTVKDLTIVSRLTVGEPLYDHLCQFNYPTGVVIDRENVDCGEDDEDPEMIWYYPGITFEKHIKKKSVQTVVADKCNSLSAEEQLYIAEYIVSSSTYQYQTLKTKITDENGIRTKALSMIGGNRMYEAIARYLAGEEYGLERLRDPNSYVSFIEKKLEERKIINVVIKQYDFPETIVCKEKVFVIAYFSTDEKKYMSNLIKKYGGTVNKEVDENTNYLVVESMTKESDNRNRAIELKSRDIDIHIIDYAYFWKLIDEGKLV